MAIKIGEAQITQLRKTDDKGAEETLTKESGPGGEATTFHVRNPDGQEVTLQGDNAIVQYPDGRMMCFKAIGSANFEFSEGFRLLPSGDTELLSMSPEQMGQDLNLIEGALGLYAKARESTEGFKEVDDLF